MKSIAASERFQNRINVLEVIGNASVGGMENYMDNFLKHLDSTQFCVTCICPYESRFTSSLRQKGLPVYITPIEDDPPWRSIQLTLEVGRLHQADVLHAHMPKAHVLAGIAGLMLNRNVVATVHGMNFTSQELGICRAVNSQLITNCQEAYFQALAMGVPAQKVFRSSNGVDTTVFTPANSGDRLRKSIGIPKDVPVIGYVGRLEFEKGPDVFLRVAQLIAVQRPDARFLIAGEGSMQEEVHQLCEQLGLQEKVHFLEWQNDTSHVYPAMDLLLQPSRSDGTSLVLLEAMASGVVAVAMAVGGLREIVEDKCTGIIVGAGDWEGMAHQALRLLKTPGKLTTMGKAARTRVEKHFDVRKNTLQTTNILRKFSGRPSPGNNKNMIGKGLLEQYAGTNGS